MRAQIRDLLNQIFTRLQKDKCGLHVWRASRSFSCQILNEHQYQITNGTSELQQNGRLSVNNDLYFSLFLIQILWLQMSNYPYSVLFFKIHPCVLQRKKSIQVWNNMKVKMFNYG